MRTKPQNSINLKIILISFFFLFLVLLIIRSSFSNSQQNSSLNSSIHPSNNSSHSHQEPKQNADCPTLPTLSQTCTKIPPSLAHALVHYTTLNITPQQTLREISVSLKVLEKRSPCNFLVFGLGHDSLMWTSLNHGGHTVFLEEDKSWIDEIQRQIPSLQAHHVVYNTKVTQADELHEIGAKEECKVVTDPRLSKCQLALKGLPDEVLDTEWDLIMVDAPTGYFDGAPGRMSAIYTAGLMARNRENARKAYSQPNNQGPQVPGLFIFGDSLVDNGNNNGILTLARANYMPYGIDFPQGTTGRFTNGRTFVDILAQLLGFPNYIPPYARTRGRALLQGANYASGASGIRDETGNNLGDHMSMNQQVDSFGTTVQQFRRFFRGDVNALGAYLSKCIFYCGLGSNDYLNNYFMTDYYSTNTQYTPKAYAASLIQDYAKQLTGLYNLGARKVIVTGVGQIGCIPYQLARYNGSGSRCNEDINSAIALFNTGLKGLVDRFNKDQLPGAKFVYLNSFESSKDLVQNARTYGFEVVDKGCCGVGRNNGQITCLPLETPCDNRVKYVFWDAFHPTEAANILLAKKAYTSKSKSYAYPINIQQLAML